MFGIERHYIAVGEGEHGVEVHGRAQLGHAGDDHLGSGVLGEQLGRHLGDGLTRRAFAHPDDDDAVPGHQHIAALDRRHTPRLFRVTPPHRRSDEVRVELVDGLHQQRLVVPCRPEQRIERHALIYPAGGVPGVERVRQGRHQILRDTRRFTGQGAVSRLEIGGQVPGRHAADQQLGQPARRQRVQERAGVIDQSQADFVRHDLAIQQPCFRVGVVHRLGKELVQFDNLDVAVAHLVDEVEVVTTGVLYPQHIVEQQVVAIGRGEPLVRQTGRAHQHLAQLADLGVNAVVGGRIRHFSSSQAVGR